MYNIVFLCAAGFIAAFVDAIAGGGGLISVPAFFYGRLSSSYSLRHK